MRILMLLAVLFATIVHFFLANFSGAAPRDAAAPPQASQQVEQTYWIYYRMSTDQVWQTVGPYPTEQARKIVGDLRQQGYEVRTGDGSGPPSPPLPPIK